MSRQMQFTPKEIELGVGKTFAMLFKNRAVLKAAGMSIWPNPKEFSESAVVYAAVRRWCPWKLDDPSIVCWAIADGASPRTGAMVASCSAWQVHSVDPRLRHSGPHPKIDRLTLHRKSVERLAVPNRGRVVLLATHSHANLRLAVQAARAYEVWIVSLPCCVKDNVGTPLRSYEDFGCLSPKRRINIYQFAA